MQNNFNNMDIPYRARTPLGYASSSSNIASLNYSPSTNQPHTSHSQGYNMNTMNSFNSPANRYSQIQSSGQQFGSNPMHFSSMNNISQMNTPNMQPQPMMPQMGAHMQPPQLVSLWNYLDNSNTVQGPFLATQMDHWLSSGFFNSDLRVCLVMSKPANPFDDPNVNLSYPYNVKGNEYFTLEQFCLKANSDLKSPIFQNFDQFSSLILRDFFLKKLPPVAMQHMPMGMPSMPIDRIQGVNHQLNKPMNSPSVVTTPMASVSPMVALETQPKLPTKSDEKFETKSAISIESMKEILSNSENKKNEYADSFSPPPERPKMSFREALALKPPKHPLAYTHKDKREIALPATKNILTRQGKYNPNYYIKSNYNYEELINIGMKDEAGSECNYSEYISYLPVGKIEDFVIETDEWPDEFFETQNNIENKLTVSYKKFTSLTSPEDIPQSEELRKYFAAVNDTTISQFVNTGGESHPLQIKDHIKLLFERFTTAMNNNCLEIDGSILAYLSRVDNITLKSIVIVFRIIFESKVEKFFKSYDAVANSFVALFPKTHIIFNKTRTVYDLPFDESIVTLLEFFIRSITLSGSISKDLMSKAIEIVQFLKKKNIKIKSHSVLDAFVKTSEYKKAKIDLFIDEIDNDNTKSSAKSANQAKLVSFLWSKVELNSYDKYIRIQAYKFDNEDENLDIFKDLEKDAPVFKWTTSISEKKEVFEVPEVVFNRFPETAASKLPEVKKTVKGEKKKEKSIPVDKRAQSPVISEKKASTPAVSEKKPVEKSTSLPVEAVKSNFSWEKEPVKSQASSILDMIQKRKEEDRKKAELAKLATVSHEQPKNNIVEALKSKQLQDTKSVNGNKNSSNVGNAWLNENFKATSPINDELRKLEKKKSTPEPEYDSKSIEEQKKLLEQFGSKNSQEDTEWVTVDKSKQSAQNTEKNPWNNEEVKQNGNTTLQNVSKKASTKDSKNLIDHIQKVSTSNGKIKKATMPETYLSSSIPVAKTNKALLAASQKTAKTKAKAAELDFDAKFIEEQKKLFQEMELKKKEQDASWVTVDKSKQQIKQKKVPVVSNTVPSANLSPDKLRKIQSQPASKGLSASKTSKPTPSKENNSASIIPKGSQKEFIVWCEKNLGDSEFLKILFSIERSNSEFFIDMANSSGMNTRPVDKKLANEFFEIKTNFENQSKFLFWNEAIDLAHQDDGGWSFQTVKKK